jgi:hypothetical protein
MNHPERQLQHQGHAVRWILVFAAISAVAMWMVVGNNWNLRDNPVASRVALVYFFVICAGPYWMIYDCWRRERKITRKMWLFFVPGGFLWYYFEVFRPRKMTRRSNKAGP